MAVITSYQNTSYVNKEGCAPIYVSFYLERKKIALSCNLSVPVKSWDKEKGKVLQTEKNHKDLNLCIEKVRARVNDIMVRYRLAKKTLSKETFMKEYSRPTDFQTFYDYFEDYVKRHNGEIENTTLDVHKDVISKMKRHSPNLTIDELTEDWLNQYKIYLKKVLNNKDSTINKNLACIKKYCRAAMKEGYMLHNPFENFKVKSRTSSGFTFLTEDELNKFVRLYKSKKLSPNKHKVLEFFLFLCFSSLHITDAKNLQIQQIGKRTFTYFRIKNRNSKPEPITVPLSEPLKSLISTLKGDRKDGKLFEHMIADQKINEYLKEIAKCAGIEKPLSCKAGRHTFATIFLQKTKDLTTLKEIMGHSDYRETLIYAHVLEESKQEGMKIFNSFSL